MDKKRVRVNIMGRNYALLSEDSEEHIKKVADEIDRRMKTMKAETPELHYDTVAMLAALNLCDELLKLKSGDENDIVTDENDEIRKQLIEYSKELSKASMLIKQLEKELEESRENEEKVRLEYKAKEREILDMIESM